MLPKPALAGIAKVIQRSLAAVFVLGAFLVCSLIGALFVGAMLEVNTSVEVA